MQVLRLPHPIDEDLSPGTPAPLKSASLRMTAFYFAQDDSVWEGCGMRTKGWEERLRELDEAGMALKVARRVGVGVDGNGQGWLRTVRRAVGIPVAEAAGRMGMVESALFRMEYAEGRGAIELQTLRRAAEALGCELVYGLAPKEGTLRGMAAVIEAGRAQARVDAWARKLQRAKDQRREAARKDWKKQERERQTRQWLEYWEKTEMDPMRLPPSVLRRIPKPMKETPYWKEAMRKSIRKALRKEGIRLR
jgi:transcriptional regulator with XRE-family HTH domain